MFVHPILHTADAIVKQVLVVMVASSCLSPISLYGGYLRHCYSAAGLFSQTVEIDEETTIHYWGPILTTKKTVDKPPASSSSPPPSSELVKPSLLLIHGFGPVAMWQWRSQVHSLSPHFNLYVPDLVFFGDSSTTKSSERSEIFQAKSIGKLMDKLGVIRYSIVGTSYGGFVAYHMASMWPERVEKVVIASSAINMTRIDNAQLVERAGPGVKGIDDILLPETPAQLRALIRLVFFRPPPPLFLPDFLLDDFLRNLYKENRDKKSELLRGVTLGRDDHANTSVLQQEILLIWGDHDQIFSLDKACELKEQLGTKSTLEVIERTGHLPHVENPVQFNKIVKNFLWES
ncbi:hypothetical protein Ancab_022588 [Ancistrocladus abbreviatus]